VTALRAPTRTYTFMPPVDEQTSPSAHTPVPSAQKPPEAGGARTGNRRTFRPVTNHERPQSPAQPTTTAAAPAPSATRPQRRRSTLASTDPITMTTDAKGRYRITYYDSGVQGVGTRRSTTRKKHADARQLVGELRERLAREAAITVMRDARNLSGDLTNATFADMCFVLFEKMNAEDASGKTKTPGGTTKKHASAYSKWVPEEVRQTRCRDLGIKHYNLVFAGLESAGASKCVVKSVTGAMSALTSLGLKNGYFVVHPFGNPDVLKMIRKTAIDDAPEVATRFARKHCPTQSDIDSFADHLEHFYPGYGHRLVTLAVSSGLRLCEVLALRVEDINQVKRTIAVRSQLDRYTAWPATAKPKHGRTRTSIYWERAAETVASLISEAQGRDEHTGWLFPPTANQKYWADAVGDRLGKAVKRADWGWTFHWLRHTFATTSLARKDRGGYNMDIEAVTELLGHKSTSTTTDYYVHAASNFLERAAQQSRL
jgi:integrase